MRRNRPSGTRRSSASKSETIRATGSRWARRRRTWPFTCARDSIPWNRGTPGSPSSRRASRRKRRRCASLASSSRRRRRRKTGARTRCSRIPTETSSGSSRSSGEPLVDEPRRARGESHDRDHRIYSGRGRQEAPVPDPQVPDLMAFPRWSRGRCPRVEPRPMFLMEDEETYWRSVETLPTAKLGQVSAPEWAALSKADAYVFFPGPADLPRYRKNLPKSAAAAGYNSEWYRRAGKAGLRGPRVLLGYVSRERAQTDGYDFGAWREMVLRASSICFGPSSRKGKKA